MSCNICDSWRKGGLAYCGDCGQNLSKVCKLVNDTLTWIMYVDEKEISFNGHHNANYFAGHYSDLGYTIKWDTDAWRRDK